MPLGFRSEQIEQRPHHQTPQGRDEDDPIPAQKMEGPVTAVKGQPGEPINLLSKKYGSEAGSQTDHKRHQ